MEDEDLLVARLKSRDSVLNEPSITKCVQLFTKYSYALQHKEAYDQESTWEEECEKKLEVLLRELKAGEFLFTCMHLNFDFKPLFTWLLLLFDSIKHNK